MNKIILSYIPLLRVRVRLSDVRLTEMQEIKPILTLWQRSLGHCVVEVSCHECQQVRNVDVRAYLRHLLPDPDGLAQDKITDCKY